MRILITGCDGFLGSHLSAYFAGQGGHAVTGLSRRSNEGPGDYRVVTCDYGATLVDLLRMESPEVVIHAAGAADPSRSLSDPAFDFDGNTRLTHNLVRCLAAAGVRPQFINLSSAAVYGDPRNLPIRETEPPEPVSPYGVHKLMGEAICTHLARINRIRSANLRIFSAYGPGLRKQVVWSIIRKMTGTTDDVLLHGTGEESRDFIYVEDICHVVRHVIQSGECAGEVYNVASGRSATIREVALAVADLIGYPGRVVFNGQSEQGKPLNWVADTSRIEALGFRCRWDLSAGLASTVAWASETMTGQTN